MEAPSGAYLLKLLGARFVIALIGVIAFSIHTRVD